MPKKRAKSVRAHKATQKEEDSDLKKAPHSFVIKSGNVGKYVQQLVKDVRKVMEPYTASKLKVKKWNRIKDFTTIAGYFNVTQILCFTRTDNYLNLRIIRQPRGPTLYFKVCEYSLTKDVESAMKSINRNCKQFDHQPLLVMKNLNIKTISMKLVTTVFQNLFPSINVNQVKLRRIRRCVLLFYDPETELIQFRHYNIRVVPTGLTPAVRKIIKKKKVPNLGNYKDISDYIENGGNLSESEAEFDGPLNEVVLPQEVSGVGNKIAKKSAIRLTELGPRMTLQLEKIEEGVCGGDVLFHNFKSKTPQEVKATEKRREAKRKLKEMRKKQQQENVMKKAKLKEEHKKKSLKGMEKAKQLKEEGTEADEDDLSKEPDEDVEEDDIEYYRQEVQAEPEPELFSKKRKSNFKSATKSKRFKKDDSPAQKKSDSKKSKMSALSKKKKENFSRTNKKFVSKKPKGKRLSSKSKSKFGNKKKRN
ncbi:suppressor of SWI4 1 homolog [Octopus sinensis]|uniref:Suppressor of SWI4 1 homolog n=1 Tax=Octopus sinensis TaxID=2607531 RepID=A0A6P7T0Y5_9MOLL|nr:suppressor of SWI4 1 homolog [Octopus sinensis]